MKFIMPMDDNPDVKSLYELIDLFKKERALVKKTKRQNRPGDSQRLKKEASYAKAVSVVQKIIAKLMILSIRPKYTCTTKQMTAMITWSSETFEKDSREKRALL